MSVDSLASQLGIYGGTFVVCFVSGLVPIINAELWLIAVTLSVATVAPLPAVVVLAAAGQMVAKMLLYFAARGALDLPTGRYHAKIIKAREKIAQWRRKRLTVLWASATIGLPPFYVVALLAGALEVGFRTFCFVGTVGRALRFGAVVVIARTGWSWT